MIKLLFFLFILILTIMVRGSENPTKSDPLAVTNIFIGTFFDVEYTKEPQKIMINENNRFVVEKSTREILKDENGKEYYIADEDKPILLLDIPIYNDFGSFDTIMSSLARAADYYLEDCSKEEKNNEIFAYVRNTNKNYSTPMWSAVCGKSDKLINALANRYTGGLEFSEYFAAFLDKDSFNLELYPNTRKEYLNRHTYLMDPSSGHRRGTDLVHFIAAFDGTCLNTGDSLDNFPLNYLDRRYYKLLVSWAGDLQTCAVKLEENNLLDISFEDILKREDLAFGMADLLADMDATILGFDHEMNSNFMFLLSNLIEFERDNNRRIKKFIEAASLQRSHNMEIAKRKFIRTVYEMLKLDENKNEYIGGNVFADIARYYYLQNKDGKICDIEYRRHLADTFIDYFISKVG